VNWLIKLENDRPYIKKYHDHVYLIYSIYLQDDIKNKKK